MKFVTIRPAGRFGNHLIYYMAAMAIAERLGGVQICGLGFPQWNIPWLPEPEMPETINIVRETQFDLAALAELMAGRDAFNIVLTMHMQRIDEFLNPGIYRQKFPVIHSDVPVFDERYLLINIRTGDIVDGHTHIYDWYPLTPIGFYQDVVKATGKLPVFLGELDDCRYVRELKAAFPDAIYIPSQGAERDFDTIRQAKHIIVAISTFSWVAAWLSEAASIHLPLSGFYNPAHKRGIDLLPVDDERYHFYLFPLNYAMSEIESLRLHAKMRGRWRKISRSKTQILRRSPARIAPLEHVSIDRHWYLSEYLDAAMDISEGWYDSPEAHFFDFGKDAGYLPYAPLVVAEPPLFANMALGKPATQSSISEWSKFPDKALDAAGAVDGDVAKDYGFHTAAERHPWWTVDLAEICLLWEIHIYNRGGPYLIRARATPLVLLCSADGQDWIELLRTAPGELFGAERGPLRWAGCKPVTARYVMIMLDSESQYLHLAQVAVFGEAIGLSTPSVFK